MKYDATKLNNLRELLIQETEGYSENGYFIANILDHFIEMQKIVEDSDDPNDKGFESDIDRLFAGIWGHLDDISKRLRDIAGEDTYRKYQKHSKNFDDMIKFINS